jgi:Mg2+/Co2+ transporter CorB
MTTKTFKQKFIEIDNRLTYIVGYRNLYNIAVMFVATWFIIAAQGELAPSVAPTVFVGAFIMLVMSGKWFLTQVRDNIDASDVYDALDAADGE